MRARLDINGATYREAAPWDLDTYAAGGMLGPLTGEALDAFIKYGAQLIAQRTLARSDLLGLATFCAMLPHLREAALVGDVESVRAIHEGLRRLGLIDGERIEPFRGERPTRAAVLPFGRGRRAPMPGLVLRGPDDAA